MIIYDPLQPWTTPAGIITFEAGFVTLSSYAVTVGENIENGTVVAPESANEGLTVTLTVTPDEGLAVDTITVMQGDTPVEVVQEDTGDYSFTMPSGNVTISVTFAYNTWVGGVRITPDEGYAVDTVTYNDGEEDHVVTAENGLYSFTMPACDVTVSATFRALSSYTITVDESIKFGTVVAPESAYESTTVTLNVNPNEGCVVESLTVMQGDTPVEVSKDYTFTMPSGNVTITAAFGYPLFVGGVKVNPGNASDIFDDGTAAYSAEQHTLTLKNYSFDGEINTFLDDEAAAIAYTGLDDFTIVLDGDSSITAIAENADVLFGIYSAGNLTIKGTGSLDVEIPKEGSEKILDNHAISSSGSITVDGVTLNLSVGNSFEQSYGICAIYAVDIIDADVSVYCGAAYEGAGIISMSAKIYVTDSTVDIKTDNVNSDNYNTLYGYSGIEFEGVRITEPAGANVSGPAIADADGYAVPEVKIGLLDTYTIAGSLDVFGEEWNPGRADNDLVFNYKTNKFEKTYNNVAAGKYEFKIAKDHTWPAYGAETQGTYIENGVALPLSYGEDSANINLYLPADISALTFAFDPVTYTVTVSWSNSIIVGVDENGQPTHQITAIPFNGYYYHNMSQHIIPAEMLNTPSGEIEALTWHYYNNEDYLERNIEVYLTEIEEDSISEFVPVSENNLVYDGTIEVDIASSDYTNPGKIYLKLDKAYSYTGKNLLVTVIDSTTSEDLYNTFHFIGTESSSASGSTSVYCSTDDENYTIDSLNTQPDDSENFVPMTKVDFKTQAPITFDGAQIRTSGVQGLRFIFSMDKAYYETLTHPASSEQTGKGFGSVILPKILVEGALTKESELAGVVPAVKLYEMTETTVSFTVCLTDISDYEREYCAIPYVTDSEGNTIYGELADGISVYDIAELCYADEKTNDTVKEYLLTNILNAVDPEKYPIAE